MKSKEQKRKEIEKGSKLLRNSQRILFADFTGMSAENMRRLRRELGDKEIKFFIAKKRLLKIILEKAGIDPKSWLFERSVGAAFSSIPAEEVGAVVHNFFKSTGSKSSEEILGGYDLASKTAISAEEMRYLGQLPSREVLLAQVMGMLVSPLRSFMYILNEKAKTAVSTDNNKKVVVTSK